MVPDHKVDTQYEALIISTDAATNQKHLNAFLSSLLKAMNKHVDVGVFKEPVDVPNVIHDPIDLKTITERVESGICYVTVEMFVADVKRMVATARILHGPNSMHRRCADRFEKYFDIRVNCEYIMWAL
ncbi:unnamed protein product [Cuscuta campestris]|uniref:Bromo domain-containing protein n=1 Tax=Cuscuta campestris TaxID=132261 RepID=A0A484MLP0_9ASTE|nr:unnamed protein product [Cuscuta campestris]